MFGHFKKLNIIVFCQFCLGILFNISNSIKISSDKIIQLVELYSFFLLTHNEILVLYCIENLFEKEGNSLDKRYNVF